MRRIATSLLMLSLMGCANPPVVITSVDSFCTRVDPFHGAEDERAALKRAVAAEPLITRFIRWAAGIDSQYDSHCLQPAKGA